MLNMGAIALAKLSFQSALLVTMMCAIPLKIGRGIKVILFGTTKTRQSLQSA